MTSTASISGRQIGDGAPCYIIAEVGINHDGDEDLARDLIAASAKAGADGVKFQTVNVDESYMPGTPSYVEFSKRMLPRGSLSRLRQHAEHNNIHFFTTPADFSSLADSIEADLPAIKISSGLLTHLPLVRAAARTGKPLIVSSGLATMAEIERTVATARQAGADQIAVLHCTSLYPAPADSLNLRAMSRIAAALDCPIGYSDHHDGALASLAAVAAGAKLIEKHITMDRTRPGADHAISLDPGTFAGMVGDIRLIETMLGSNQKTPDQRELPARDRMRRVLVVKDGVAAGDVLDETTVAFMRVTDRQRTIAVEHWDDWANRRFLHPKKAGDIVHPEDIGDRA